MSGSRRREGASAEDPRELVFRRANHAAKVTYGWYLLRAYSTSAIAGAAIGVALGILAWGCLRWLMGAVL